MTLTCEDIKTYLDRYIDKFKSSGVSIIWGWLQR